MNEGIDAVVCEAGVRDGLQRVRELFSTAGNLAWIEAQAAAAA